MTREEAHKILSNGLVNAPSEHEWCMAFEMAIKALEQAPCEDAISRESAIDAVSEALEHVVIEHEDVAKKMINKLPPVKPQELCEDTISRILKIMWNCRGKNTTSIDKVKMEQIIRDELQPKQESCEDAIRREDALQALCKAVHKNDDTIPCSNQRESCLWSKTKVQDYAREIWKLPSVTPQPKTGHWISHYDEDAKEGWYECDRCHTERAFNTKFCPDCGRRMVEPQESAYAKCPICANRNKSCQFGSLDCHFEEQIDVSESEG